MIGKLLNFGKKEEFFLELNENGLKEAIAPAQELVATVKSETKTVVEKIEQTTSEVKQAVTESAATAVETPQATSTTTPKSAKPAKSGKKGKKPAATTPAPQPVAIDTSYSEEPFWVKLMYKSSAQKAAEQNAEKTFATDYLIAKPQPRRRPGGSVDKFKTMARQTRVKF